MNENGYIETANTKLNANLELVKAVMQYKMSIAIVRNNLLASGISDKDTAEFIDQCIKNAELLWKLYQ